MTKEIRNSKPATPPSGSTLPADRSAIAAEQRNPRSMHLGQMNTADIVRLIRQEDAAVLTAMAGAEHALIALIDAIVPCFERGGRIIYIGAGTSGRLGVLDASEAPPTFCVEPDRIVGLIAGGDPALRRSSEGAEDDRRGSHAALDALHLTADDSLIGIAAGATTPYVHGALEHAKRSTPAILTAFIVCSPIDRPACVDHLILLGTGPEVLTGSTRMKAGTATKLALNTLSTAVMVRTGRVYQNLMVDVRATNDKLRDRAARIISQITGLQRPDAFTALDHAAGSVKTAIVMLKRQVDRPEAERLLQSARGRLADVIRN